MHFSKIIRQYIVVHLSHEISTNMNPLASQQVSAIGKSVTLVMIACNQVCPDVMSGKIRQEIIQRIDRFHRRHCLVIHITRNQQCILQLSSMVSVAAGVSYGVADSLGLNPVTDGSGQARLKNRPIKEKNHERQESS